jgi:two-component system cell cycle response regulator
MIREAMQNNSTTPDSGAVSNASKLGLFDLNRYEQLKATGDLPSPKGAALAIIRLTQRESLSITELAQVVRTDPAFVGRLIKTANSVQANSRRPIVSIQDALNVLGIAAVRTLALSFSLLSGYRSGTCEKFDYQRYWSHSLVCAVAMQALALRVRMCTPDEAFSIGLLARIGELALATTFPDDFSRIIGEREVDASLKLPELEQQAFAMTDSELTTAMLLDWGIPSVLAEPVYFHDDPDHSGFVEGSRKDVIARALALAEYIGDICLASDFERRSMMSHLFMLGGRLSIDAESLTVLCDRVAIDWADWGLLLNVNAPTVPPFDELLRAPAASAIEGKSTEEGGPSRLRVLVVDDDRSMRAVLKGLLNQSGHEVFEASSGEQGFEMALDLRPHLMVIDWMMPGMSGVELTRALRETKIGRSIYVLILTALEDEGKLIEAFENGVDDFLTKPLNARVMAARLRAGHRVVQLQSEIERDREDIRKFAAELAVTNRRLQEVALTDSLTGFPNRRYAMERIVQEWSAGDRNKRPLSCMVIDLDAFKRINDTYGHDVGDSVLKSTAAAIKSGLRIQDVVCRIGGDEFLAICPDTDLAAAMACGERVRLAVAALPLEADGVHLQGSVSIGVATRDVPMSGVDALIKMADRGVYLAKDRGRNCVAAAQSGQ